MGTTNLFPYLLFHIGEINLDKIMLKRANRQAIEDNLFIETKIMSPQCHNLIFEKQYVAKCHVTI